MELRLVPLEPSRPDPRPGPPDLAALAIASADALLAARWSPGRHRLELAGESCPFARGADRHRYRARVRVWEPLCRVDVTFDRDGRPCAARLVTDELGAEPDAELVEGAELAPDDASRRSAGEAALRAARGLALADEPTAVRGARRLGTVVRVGVERGARDGLVVVDLDPCDGTRLGWLVGPFQRGSRRCAALSRATIVERARAQLALAPDARLVQSRLVSTPSAAGGLVRSWRLRFVSGERTVIASLNARTGVLAGVAGGPTRGARPLRADRVVAAADLALVARLQLGPAARVGVLVAGAAVDAGGRPRPLWLAVVTTPRGPMRATVDGGRVSFAPLAVATRLA